MHLDGNRWTFTRRFAKKKGQSRFLDRLNCARNFFPELESETVKVGITVNADGKADLKGKAVFFRSRNVSFYVLGHELTHLLQEVEGLPKSERSCDIYTLARTLAFCDESPNYIKVPKRMIDENGFILERYRKIVHDVAVAAIAMKRGGEKRYIRWFEKMLEDLLVREKQNQWDAFESPEWMLRQETIQTHLEEFL